jgi:hypothetical protein
MSFMKRQTFRHFLWGIEIMFYEWIRTRQINIYTGEVDSASPCLFSPYGTWLTARYSFVYIYKFMKYSYISPTGQQSNDEVFTFNSLKGRRSWEKKLFAKNLFKFKVANMLYVSHWCPIRFWRFTTTTSFKRSRFTLGQFTENSVNSLTFHHIKNKS